MALMGTMLVAESAGMGPISSRIPGALVFAVLREMAPLLVGLLLASLIGARVGSELAGMSYTSQLDSMRVCSRVLGGESPPGALPRKRLPRFPHLDSLLRISLDLRRWFLRRAPDFRTIEVAATTRHWRS